MTVEDHRALRELLGAYVLAQLDHGERVVVDRHLAGCATCRSELAGLQPLATALRELDPALRELDPALRELDPALRELDPALADAVAPPTDLGDRVLQSVQARRRAAARRARWRRAGAGVLAAASVAAAFAVGTWWVGPRLDPPVIAVALHLDQPGLTADAGLVRHTWGTELQLEATGLAVGDSYAVTFVRDDGARVSAGSFLGTGAQPVRCSVNAALPVESASELVITDARGDLVMDARLR